MSIKREDVERALEQARVILQRDGGDVALVDITDDGIVQVQLQGACGGCPMATMTLKAVIEEFIRQEAPDVVGVEAV